MALGEYDLVMIMEAPDNKIIASLLMAVSGAGDVTNLKTTALITSDEGLEALQDAGSIDYSSPKLNNYIPIEKVKQGFNYLYKPTVGFEPTTYSLRKNCSTPELRWQDTVWLF